MGLDRGREYKRRRYVRHIRLIRPCAEEILLVTDLLDNQQYPASDLLAVYLTRWGIAARVPADHGGLRVAPFDRLHAPGGRSFKRPFAW